MPDVIEKRRAMRQSVTDWMRSFQDDKPPSHEEIANALLDFGFYHPLQDVKRMFAEYVNWGNYGYPGGVLDQPDEYWHDMGVMQWLKLWVKHVDNAPRLEQTSVFNRLREGGSFGGHVMKAKRNG